MGPFLLFVCCLVIQYQLFLITIFMPANHFVAFVSLYNYNFCRGALPITSLMFDVNFNAMKRII